MRPAKEIFLEQAAKKEEKHPKTAPKIICFSLAMGFLGLSILLLGIGHGITYTAEGITSNWAKTILILFAVVTVQATVVLSSLGVTSSKYTLHCISGASLAVSLAIDVGLILYYTIWVI